MRRGVPPPAFMFPPHHGFRRTPGTVQSEAPTPQGIIEELRSGQFARVAERSGRAQDAEDGGGLETLRRDGYM
jgi:hypothetical protein